MVKAFKNLLFQNQKSYDLETLLEQRGLKLYTVYINDDPWLTLTYFTARSNWVICTFEYAKTVTKSFNGGNLTAKDYID